MLTDTAPHARLVVSRQLLIKSSDHFAHSGKHALYGNPPRWHLIAPNKPAPKGAPIAHDPGAVPATPYQMPAEQVEQIKLPDSNTNAGTFNKQVDKVVGFASTGNAAAILGMQIGVNTYGAKLAKISNFLLQNMGVHEHVVSHGQAAGAHTALQAAPKTPATTPDLQEPGPLAPLAQHVKDTLDEKAADGDVEFIKLVAANNPEHPQIVAYAQQKLAELDGKAPAPAPVESPAPPAPSGPLAMPAFEEGKTTTGVVDYYKKVAQKIIDHGHAGNASVLEGMKADGLKPNAKGKTTNTWLGKTANSKKLLALHAAALDHAKGGSAPSADASATGATSAQATMPAFDTYSDAQEWAKARAKEQGLSWQAYTATPEYKDHIHPALAKLYQSHKAGWDAENAEAGKKLQAAMADAGVKPGDTVSWTQVGSFLSQTKMSGVVKLDGNGVPFVHLSSEVAVSKPGGKIGYSKKLRWQPYMTSAAPAATKAPPKPADAAAGPAPLASFSGAGNTVAEVHKNPKGFAVVLKDKDSGEALPSIKIYPTQEWATSSAENLAAGKPAPKDGDTKPGADGKSLVFKDGRWHKYVDADEHGELPPVLAPVSDPAPAAAAWNTLTTDQKASILAVVSPLYTTGYTGKPNAAAKKMAAAGWGALTDQVKSKVTPYISMHAHAKQEAAAKPAPVMPEKPVAAESVADKGQSPLKTIGGITFEAVKSGAVWKVKVAGTDKLIDGIHSDSKGGLWSKLNQHHGSVGADSFASEFGGKTETPLSPQQLQNLQSIPWFKLKLPAENTNAKSHNAALAKIEAMAFAGDTAGLQAFIDAKGGAKQTYAKKQVLTAQTALAGLQQPGATAAVPVEPSPAKPASPLLSGVSADTAIASFKAASPNASLADFEAKWKEANAGKVGLNAEWAMAANPAPAAPPPAAHFGPKEGDTKQGADGMLVLKDGRWVKMDTGDDGPGDWSFSANDPAFSGANAIGNHEVLMVFSPGDGAELHTSASMEAGYGEPELQAHTVHELVQKMAAAGHSVPPLSMLKKLDPGYEPPAAAAPPAIKKLDLSGVNKILQSLPPSLVPQVKFSSNAASKMALGAAKTGDAAGMAAAYSKALDMGYKKTGGHIKAVAEAMGVDTSKWNGGSVAAPAAAPAPAAKPTASNLPSMDSWIQTGPQGGSNPGGKFRDPSGQEWYCKFPGDEATAKSEILAAKLYGLAGLSGQDAILVSKGGKVGIATKWVDIKKAPSAAALSKVDGVHSGFAVDAWLGNWDVVGMSLDNLQIGPDGKAHRVDAGGSLEYRAQGAKKPFGTKVEEIDALRDVVKNPHAAAVFAKMTKADIVASVAKVAAISDVTIRAMVNQYGPGTQEEKAKLAETLIARKADLLKRYPQAAKKKKAIVFDPSKVSAPPSFLNWGGSGKGGPSSKEFLNKANEEAAQAIYQAAKTGNLDAIKSLQANVYDKDTGAVVGSKPVLEHPSQHIKGYAQQVINEINYQMNPPKRFRFDGGHPLHSLNVAYPAHHGAPSSAAAQKLGKYIVLGTPGTVKLEDLALPPKITHSSAGGSLNQQTYSPAAQAAIAKMPATQRQAVQSYTGSSYHAMNNSLWAGNPTGAAKSAGEALKTLGHDIAPGTVLSRKINLHGAGLEAMLASSGKILQEPAIMSTSIRPSSWSGNVQLKLHVGPGVKGLWVGPGSKPGGGALSKHASEDEMILPPGTRMLIMSVKKGPDSDGFGQHGSHIIEAVILPT